MSDNAQHTYPRKVTIGHCRGALNWLEANKADIIKAAPITHRGVTYRKAYIEALAEASASHTQDDSSRTLAEAYVYRPLFHIRAAMELNQKTAN